MVTTKKTMAKKSTKKTAKAKRTPTSKKKVATTKATTKATIKKAVDTKKMPRSSKASNKDVVTIDRRTAKERRRESDRREKSIPVATERRVVQRRAKVARRRQIDPTTCERDYTGDEIEFMNALDRYKRASGRMFPTCSEVLEVIRKLGYVKHPLIEPAEHSADEFPAGFPPQQIQSSLPA